MFSFLESYLIADPVPNVAITSRKCISHDKKLKKTLYLFMIASQEFHVNN